jgi:hypothetical protein
MSTQAITPIDTKPIENKLAILKARAEAIVVSDQEGYTAAVQLAMECRSEIKAIGFVLDPGIESAKKHLDLLRSQKDGFVNPLKAIDKTAAEKAANWKAEERRQAQIEEDRKNAEIRAEANRKAAEEKRIADAKAVAERKEAERLAEQQRKDNEKLIEEQRKRGDIGKREAERLKKKEAEDAEQARMDAEDKEREAKALAEKQSKETAANVKHVHVAPAVPKFAGARARVNPKWKMLDITKVPREYLYPNDIWATENFPKITVEVRKSREGEGFVARKVRLEEMIPGIEYFEEDKV